MVKISCSILYSKHTIVIYIKVSQKKLVLLPPNETTFDKRNRQYMKSQSSLCLKYFSSRTYQFYVKYNLHCCTFSNFCKVNSSISKVVNTTLNCFLFCFFSLVLKEEASDYLELDTVKNLVTKYSQFINFPIYVWSSKVHIL